LDQFTKGANMVNQELGPSPEDIGLSSEETGSEGLAEYVSTTDVINRVHQFGGSTREIVGAENVVRINELQSKVGKYHNDLEADEWNELMALKTDAKAKMEQWLEEAMRENKEAGRLAYVETTDTIKRVHEFGGHTSDLISRADMDIINSLQPRLKSLNTSEWNELMAAKKRAVETMEHWVSMQ
jgi:hypothetical protein